MKASLIRTWTLTLLMLAAGWGSTASADHPSYVILQAPRLGPHGTAPRGTSPGYGFGVQSNGYAYGWFGATSRTTGMSRHFGYYRQYTQWSTR